MARRRYDGGVIVIDKSPRITLPYKSSKRAALRDARYTGNRKIPQY